MAATIYIDDELWRTFRITCIAHHTSASKEIARMIQEQLATWAHTEDTTSDD
jgi:hypothetical protein